jgi:hypothetical protein
MKHPLLPVALLYVGGILAGRFVSLPLFLLLTGSLGLAVLALAWAQARPLLLWPLVLLTGWTNLTLQTTPLSPIDLRHVLGRQPEIVTIRGSVRETPWYRVYEQDEKEFWRTLTQIDVTALCPNRQTWRQATGRIAVTTPGMLTNFFAGQIVEITGVAQPPRIAVAPGTFDYQAYLRQLGIYYSLQASSEQDWRSSPRHRLRRSQTVSVPGRERPLRSVCPPRTNRCDWNGRSRSAGRRP